jgi:hypothetical protein
MPMHAGVVDSERNDVGWQRLGASSAIAWFVLLLGNFAVVPIPPGIDDSTSAIAAYFSNNDGRMQLNAVLGALSGIALLWFAGYLRQSIQWAGGSEMFSSIVFGSGVIFALLNALRPTFFLTLAMVAHQVEGSADAVFRAVYDLHTVFNGVIGIAAAAFLATVGIAMRRGELAQRWLGSFGLLAALLALIAGIAEFYATSAPDLASGINVAAILTIAVWFVVAGGVIWYRPQPRSTRGSPP